MRPIVGIVGITLITAACGRSTSMTQAQLDDFGTRYAAAWSSKSPDQVAAFYSENGSLRVNEGQPAVGRSAVRATAEGFMTGFPDMVVRMASMIPKGAGAEFHWIWTGTNTGPGGPGKRCIWSVTRS